MVIFEFFYRQNLIQLYTKMYDLKKISLVSMPPNPPSKLPNLKKIFLAPPPCQILGMPLLYLSLLIDIFI